VRFARWADIRRSCAAEGAYLFDADGNRYVDLFGSWGPMILGHAFLLLWRRIREAAGRGASFGASHAGEANLAELVRRCFPSVEKMRFVSSGTEACMSAIRLARGLPRNFVIKFEGCYHGHADALLVKAGSGVATLGFPVLRSAGGDGAAYAGAAYNDLAAVEETFRALPDQIACINRGAGSGERRDDCAGRRDICRGCASWRRRHWRAADCG